MPYKFLLVNTAGIAGGPVKFLDLDSKNIDEVFNINFKSMINVSQSVATGMIQHGIHGTIVNVSSVMSSVAYYRQSLYCTSKAAVTMLTKNMALELQPANIRVNSVSPTVMATKMTLPKSVIENKDDSNESTSPKLTRFMNTLVNRQIPKRLLTVDETADLILFLSSSCSAMMTGENVGIDGGMLAVVQ